MSTVFVVEPDESGRGPVYRMSDVVDAPTVTVAPGVGYPHRADVVTEERPSEFRPRLLLESDSRRVLEKQQSK
jgi:hypothetical protein